MNESDRDDLRAQFGRLLQQAELDGFILLPFDSDIARPGGLWGLAWHPDVGIVVGILRP